MRLRDSIGPPDRFPAVAVDIGEGGLTGIVGGGLRFYLSTKVGIRPEFQVVRIRRDTFVRMTFGIFY